MTPDELISQIEKAFADVQYPGDASLTDSTYGEEPAALIKAFSGKNDWKRLDAKFLDQAPDGWGSALSFFSGNALRFYLPAYMIADIRGELTRADPTSRLCTSLMPQAENKKIAKVWGGSTMGDHARKDFSSFDIQQVSAIVAYLRWRMKSDDCDFTIGQALDNYWLRR